MVVASRTRLAFHTRTSYQVRKLDSLCDCYRTVPSHALPTMHTLERLETFDCSRSQIYSTWGTANYKPPYDVRASALHTI